MSYNYITINKEIIYNVLACRRHVAVGYHYSSTSQHCVIKASHSIYFLG